MKLIIQIPCLNEEQTLPETIAGLPREVDGFEVVEYQVIDDGSTDNTVGVARSLGVEHIVRMNGNQGLARAFMSGLVAAVERGADVIVNTDADNQYRGEDVHRLVEPIIAGRADIVVGTRPIKTIQHFSPVKRALQAIGSRAVRALSGTVVDDAPSGFRAFTRDAALRLNVFGQFTYTIETIIQAGLSNLRISSVPIRVNGPTRPSRLFRSNLGYIRRSILTMLSVYVIYRPMRIFNMMSLLFFVPSLFLAVRYLGFMLAGEGRGHVQSVIASAVLLLCCVFVAAIGIVAHLQSINRRLLEEVRYLELSRVIEGRSLYVDMQELSKTPIIRGAHHAQPESVHGQSDDHTALANSGGVQSAGPGRPR